MEGYRKGKIIYEVFITLSGIGLTLYYLINTTVNYPPPAEYLIYSLVALLSAYLSIEIKNIIISFDIIIYFFLLLQFGAVCAGITAIMVILTLWIFKSIPLFRKNSRKEGLETLRMGFYNSGVYGLIYLLGGYVFNYLEGILNIGLAMPLSILFIVILNEITFSLDTILSDEDWLDYFREEGCRSDILEYGVYLFGISMFFLYRLYGFIYTVPILIGLILLTYLGKRMSDYYSKLNKNLDNIVELSRISHRFCGILNLEGLIKDILREIKKMVGPDRCTIKIKSAYNGKEYNYMLNNGSIEEVDENTEEITDAEIEIPLMRNQKQLGLLTMDSGRRLNENEMAIIQNIAEQASVSLSNTMMYNLSIKDPLTGLFSRRHFESRLGEELARADREECSFSLVMFDIDSLKKVNDSFGHKVGDEVLKLFSKLMKSYTRPFDISARWGGDEFLLILPRTGVEKAVNIAERIIGNFSGTRHIDGNPVDISAEYSVEEYIPNSGINGGQIFYNVDKRLVDKKNSKH